MGNAASYEMNHRVPRVESPSPAAATSESAKPRLPRLLLPHEHGAWGMVSLPFLVGAIAAGDWIHWRALAGALAAFSIFLSRAPLLALLRARAVASLPHAEAAVYQQALRRQARFSLAVFGSIALASSIYLCWTLPPLPLGLLGAGGLILYAGTAQQTLRNHQRSLWFQLVSVPGLTASALLGYLAASGELAPPAFWIWMLFTAHLTVSVMVVRAQLEKSVAAVKRRPVSQDAAASRRRAVVVEAALWLALGWLTIQGQSSVALAFLPPSIFHWWLLWRLGADQPVVPMRRVGFAALTTSILFSILLLALLV